MASPLSSIGPYTIAHFAHSVITCETMRCSVCDIGPITYFIYYNGTAAQYKNCPPHNYVCSEECFALWLLRAQ